MHSLSQTTIVGIVYYSTYNNIYIHYLYTHYYVILYNWLPHILASDDCWKLMNLYITSNHEQCLFNINNINIYNTYHTKTKSNFIFCKQK